MSAGDSRPLNVGLIGCGLVMEMKHMQVLPGLSGLRVLAAADVDRARLDRVANSFGIARRYDSAEALLADDEVDVVGVCTPPAQHAEIVVAAIAAGKHVLVEKPLALDVEACDRMITAASSAPALRVMVGFHMRFHHQTRRARAMVRAGELGPIELIRGIWTNPIRLARDLPPWRDRRESGGGSLVELGVHQFDQWRFLSGSEVSEVYAITRSEEWPDASVTLSARLDDGVLVSQVISEVTGHDIEYEIYGRDARLHLACLRFDGLERFGAETAPGSMGTRLRMLARGLKELPRGVANRHGGDYLASYRDEWVHLAGCVRTGANVDSTLDDGREAVRIALASIESAQTGKPVRVTDAPTRITSSTSGASP
jgi:predicted dehydrogenase